jgi:hypothetical protein
LLNIPGNRNPAPRARDFRGGVHKYIGTSNLIPYKSVPAKSPRLSEARADEGDIPLPVFPMSQAEIVSCMPSLAMQINGGPKSALKEFTQKA